MRALGGVIAIARTSRKITVERHSLNDLQCRFVLAFFLANVHSQTYHQSSFSIAITKR